ncbi:MAG: SMAD/FHA domain-containing protein [Monoraphidium minutum]|nr:MAG: SMAD/FHA domain-containing protein [Monoraphidium minutum]
MPASSGPRPLRLTVIAGPNPGNCFSKPGASKITIGRVKSNTFWAKEASVSSKHGEFIWDDSVAAGGGTWFVVDVGSSNGTQINGGSKLIEGQRYPLRDQDIIQLGPDMQLQVAIDAPSDDAARLTVEQKLTVDAQRIAASIQAAAAAMASQIREEWRTQRQEMEALLSC